MEDRTNIKRLMRDVANYENSKTELTSKFSKSNLEDKLRSKLIEAIGLDNPTLKDLRRANASKAFEIVEEFLTENISGRVNAELPFATVKSVEFGQKVSFKLENPDLYNVAIVAKGNGNGERQRLENGRVEVSTDAMEIKVFHTFLEYMSGQVSFAEIANKVMESYVSAIRDEVHEVLLASTAYNGDTNMNVTVTGAFDADKLELMADQVRAKNQVNKAYIVATRNFLRSYVGSTLSDGQREELADKGYVEMWNGNILIAITQTTKHNSFDLSFDDKTALVLPATNVELIKIVEEGEDMMIEGDLNMKGNMDKELLFYRHTGVAVANAIIWGKYSYTG